MGLLLSIVLIAAAGWSFLWGGLLGVVAFLVLGFVLPQVICTGDRASRPLTATSTPSSLVAGDPPAPMPDASVAAPREAETPAVQPAPEAHPIASEAARPVAQDTIVTAPEDLEKPATLDAPRAGGADDLKRIKGVGPKLETMLHDMGFYHFDQIANWTEAEIDWVDRNLAGFKGRASRDQWVRQAVTLARGDAN
ncbi:NADH:ubiquinone oxidoreductase [Roseovarius sp. M141]|nr:NADH:ubiquinone oxidoreductase [Roseovarius sp. M141]